MKGNKIFYAGQIVKVFDGSSWQKTGDIGDNSQFYKEAEILLIYNYTSTFGTVDRVADVKWKHNGEISKAHFLSAIKTI